MRSGFPPPSAYRIHSRLGQNRVPTLNVDSLHAAIASNQRFDLHDSLQRHASREGWVSGRHMFH